MTFRFDLPGRALRSASVIALLCPAAAAAQRQNGLLVGRVLSGDVAVPNAAIFVSGGRVTLARVDGRFRLSLPAGRYEVRAQRIGYTSGRDSVTIVAGDSTVANFRIERSISMLEQVASVGTRGYERSVIDAPAPVDVIGGAELRAMGRTQTSRELQALAPGVNAPRAGLAEGSDLVHPVTLRGLGPDQVLVLVNGRRRHTSALMNANGTTGRGSTGVDLDAIPATMIDHVEVLRDNAAAQYGGEATAGVINVVLKSGVHGDAMTTVGGNVTTFNVSPKDVVTPSLPGASYPVGERGARDGRTVHASIDKGVVFGERGFLHGDLELRSRELTNRALPDPRNQYPVGDPRFGQTGVSQDVVSNRLGEPASRDLALFLNGGNLLRNGMELYANAGGSRRTLEAAGLFRRPVDPVTNTAQNPNGFLPVIAPTIDDYAGTVGARGMLDEWRWDLGTTYGRNTVDYEVRNTQSAFGPAGTTFDAGRVRYGQSTTTLDLFRTLNVSLFDELRLGAGAELRRESYAIGAASGTAAIEGFPGFTTTQAVDRSRHDLAGYADLEADVGPDLLVALTGRAEHFSDVGTLGAGKLAVRYNPVPRLALRASAARSERAPSLSQSSYGTLANDPGTSGVFTAIVRVDAPQAIALGATTLRPERTSTLSGGVAFETSRAFFLSVDYYLVDVKDRITLLESVASAPTSAILYSANAADTRTSGVDLNTGYGFRMPAASSLRLTLGANFNHTQVTAVRPPVSGIGLGNVGITRIEHGQPASSVIGTANYRVGALGALLRAQRFGEVRVAGIEGTTVADQTLDARTVLDANVSYTLLRKYTLTAGADNILDAYPERNFLAGSASVQGNGYFGIFPYNAASPFGFNGRFVYGRLSIYL